MQLGLKMELKIKKLKFKLKLKLKFELKFNLKLKFVFFFTVKQFSVVLIKTFLLNLQKKWKFNQIIIFANKARRGKKNYFQENY